MTVSAPDAATGLAAQRGGAKALLLTVLGEFVLPAGGAAWTSTFLASARLLGIGEKNTRQAIARIADQGIVVSERHGRTVRWTLTPSGRELLETGTRRIYGFGRSDIEWEREWLTAHCPVPESQRPLRHRLRTELAFLGFGELSASLMVSPHLDRETELRSIVAELGIGSECTVLRSRTASAAEDADIVARAWSLGDLADGYREFVRRYADRNVIDDDDAFRATVELVHDWRHFPSIDPELPPPLLPADWVGESAVELFHDRHAEWSPAATGWFRTVD